MVERQSCKLKVLGSIPSGGCFAEAGWRSSAQVSLISKRCAEDQGGRLCAVKGVDLRSTAGSCAWVPTPQSKDLRSVQEALPNVSTDWKRDVDGFIKTEHDVLQLMAKRERERERAEQLNN